MSTTARCFLIGLVAYLFGSCGFIFLATPGAAKVPGCDTSSNLGLAACTDAQMRAFVVRQSALLDTSTARSIVNAYIEYLDAILLGYTPNDETLQDALNNFFTQEEDYLNQPSQPDKDWYFPILSFMPSDVFETFNDDIEESSILSMRTDGYWGAHAEDSTWPMEDFTAAAKLEECDEAICNRVSDRVVAMLGGGFSATKDSQFTDPGFRITGLGALLPGEDLDHYHSEGLWEIDSFGIWAQDSYWGVVWQDARYAGFPDARPAVATRALFIAGGRDPTKPMGSGTWRGLAVGTRLQTSAEYEYADGSPIRVGHSEITVHLDSSEVDVTITGIAEGFSGKVRLGDGNDDLATVTVEALSQLEWKGLSLGDNGYFADIRPTGVVPSLDHAFGSDLPPEGEAFGQTHYTIDGQFHGTGGQEVVGVFNKSGYVGSFGGYQE